MRKIAIIGMGHVGSTVAYTLFTHGIADKLVLFDNNFAKVEAEYNDLHDSISRNNYFVDITMQNWKELCDTDIIITSFGDIAATVKTGDRFGEFDFNAANAKEIGSKIKKSDFKGVLINISNPCDAVSSILQKYTGLTKNQVFGTGTFLDTARMQRIVGEKLGIDPHSVSGYVLGEHGSSQFTAWSTVLINNKKSELVFNEETRQKLSLQSNKNSLKVAKGKGYTSYAIASCAIKLVQAVFSDSHLIAPISTYVEELDTYIGYPAIIGKNGVERQININMLTEESKKLNKSAEIIKRNIAKLNK